MGMFEKGGPSKGSVLRPQSYFLVWYLRGTDDVMLLL